MKIINIKYLRIVFSVLVLVFLGIKLLNSSANTQADQKLESELAKFPAEARNASFTMKCQEMQRPFLMEKGAKTEEVADMSSLIPCTCITAALIKTPHFEKIEQLAKDGSEFLEILKHYNDPLLQIMQNCGN